MVLSGMFVLVGYAGSDRQLYAMAAFFFVLKVVVIPYYLRRLRTEGWGRTRVAALHQHRHVIDYFRTARVVGLRHHPACGER